MIRLGHTPGVAGLSALMLITGISAELPRVTTESPRGFRITIRHDRPDSAYVQLGSRFPAVVQVGRAGALMAVSGFDLRPPHRHGSA